MLVASSVALLYSLGQDDQKKVQQDLSGHVMLYASASCDADAIINSIIVFVRSRQSKWGAT